MAAIAASSMLASYSKVIKKSTVLHDVASLCRTIVLLNIEPGKNYIRELSFGLLVQRLFSIGLNRYQVCILLE